MHPPLFYSLLRIECAAELNCDAKAPVYKKRNVFLRFQSFVHVTKTVLNIRFLSDSNSWSAFAAQYGLFSPSNKFDCFSDLHLRETASVKSMSMCGKPFQHLFPQL